MARVLISIVTYNSAQVIERCLESVFGQTFTDYLVAIADNASSDATLDKLERLQRDRLRLLKLDRNTGYAAAQNLLIRSWDSEYVLTLNPDAYLKPDYLARLLDGLALDSRAGSATGKLLRAPLSFFAGALSEPPEPAAIDSTGIYFTPTLRHLDRGSGEMDAGQYDRTEYVFGASGAAALYRRSMLQDTAIDGEYFDEAFFAYREDADLAWRAQLLGWRCLYIPGAVAYHLRRVVPEKRNLLPAEINMHSVKNRFLMRAKNLTIRTYLKFFLPIAARDLMVFGYILLKERSSIRGLKLAAAGLPRALRARRAILGRRRVSDRYIEGWFSFTPRVVPYSSPRESNSAATPPP